MNSTSVLFVCAGNICRSPMAEGVFHHLVDQADLNDHIQIDSAGVGAWHVGEQPNERTIKELAKNGIKWRTHARQITKGDFTRFDHIVAMDRSNKHDLELMFPAERQRVSMMMDWADQWGTDVPDPYYGTQADFALVYEMVSEGCAGLLTFLSKSSGFTSMTTP